MNKPTKTSLKVLDGQTEIAEEELEKLSEIFNKFSKPLFYIVLLVVVLYFGNQFYQEAKLKSLKDGATQLEVVQKSFQELLEVKRKEPNNQQKISEVTTRLNAQIKVLGDKPKPYGNLAQVYSNLILKEYELDYKKIVDLINSQ